MSLARVFTFLDQHPAAYWIPAVLTLAGCGFWLRHAWAQSEPRGRRFWGSDGVFALLSSLTLLAWRWPALLEAHAIGPAEAEVVAAAAALRADLLPWRGVDPINSGPLTLLALWPTHWLGVPADFFNERLVVLGLDVLAIVGAYRLFRRVADARAARVSAMLLLVGWALALTPDAVANPAHHVVGFLAVWTLAGLAAVRCPRTPRRRAALFAAAAGILAGLMPFVGGPGLLVALLLFGGGVVALVRSGRSWKDRRDGVAWFAGAALYVHALGLAWVHGASGFVPDPASWAVAYSAPTLQLGSAFNHAPAYLSVGLLSIAVLGVVRRVKAEARPTQRAGALAVAALSVAAAVRIWAGPPTALGQLADFWRHPRSELGDYLHALREPQDTMVVWGERPQLHIETQLPLRARSLLVWREVGEALGLRSSTYFGARYVRDVQAARPTFFVDAVAPPAAGAVRRHECLPELAEFIRREYTLTAERDGARVYVFNSVVADRAIPRPGVKPLRLASMTTQTALVVPFPLDAKRIFAHAPSRLVHPVPPGAWQLKGGFGFEPGAYAKAETATDGATFAVNGVDGRGARRRLFERRMDPFHAPGDRGLAEFAVDLRNLEMTQVELVIESGPGTASDWTYWADLRFEETH